MKNSFLNSDENEFLAVDLAHSQIAKSRSISTDQIISKLQQKNTTLKSQVNKIQRVLSQMKVQQKPRYGISLPQIKPDTIKKELQNAYKQIKIYEHQIEKRRENTYTGDAAYIEQVNRIQKLYKQKVQIHEKLKRQILALKHQSKELTKQLKNNSKKLEYEMLETKLSTDIKYLKEKVRDFEAKRSIHITNLQKQRSMIKQMENQFLQQNPNQTLQAIKIKIFRPNDKSNSVNLTPSRSIFQIQEEAAKQQSRVSSKIMFSLQEEQQQKTQQIFASLLNDARLLKKMQTDYENKMIFLMKQRDEAAQKNFASRNRLLQVQYVTLILIKEIQTIQKSIIELKKLIDPAIFKPKLLQNNIKKKQVAKPKGLSISHSFKFIQHGEITKNGKRFSDRAIIGKINSKIIGMTLYQKQQTGQFIGLQAVYRLQGEQDITKKANLNTRLDLKKQAFKSQIVQLEGHDYIKTIDLFKLQKRIVGISLFTMKNKTFKCGDCTVQRIPLTMQQAEYPMCFYGSMLTDGFQCFGVQILQLPQNKDKEKQPNKF